MFLLLGLRRATPNPLPRTRLAVLVPSTISKPKKTANDIDESQDGVIKRMEWMRYTAVLDEARGK